MDKPREARELLEFVMHSVIVSNWNPVTVQRHRITAGLDTAELFHPGLSINKTACSGLLIYGNLSHQALSKARNVFWFCASDLFFLPPPLNSLNCSCRLASEGEQISQTSLERALQGLMRDKRCDPLRFVRGHRVPQVSLRGREGFFPHLPSWPLFPKGSSRKGFAGAGMFGQVAASPEHDWEYGIHLLCLATLPTWLRGTETWVFLQGPSIQSGHALCSRNTGEHGFLQEAQAAGLCWQAQEGGPELFSWTLPGTDFRVGFTSTDKNWW